MEYLGKLINKYKKKKYSVFKTADVYHLNGEDYLIFQTKREFDIYVSDEKLEFLEVPKNEDRILLNSW